MSVELMWAWTLLAFVVHDLGWILWHPLLALSACCAGCFVLALITQRQAANGCDFDLAVTVSALLWFVGNLLWNFIEFVLEEDEPAGFLAGVGFVRDIGDEEFETFMLTAVAMMLISLFWFILYVFVNNALVFGRCADDPEHLSAHVGSAPLRPPVTLVLCQVPFLVYMELSFIPWIIMDTSWCLANAAGPTSLRVTTLLLTVGMLGGALAVALEVDCARRMFARGRNYAASMYVAEMLWVLGNMVWMSEDLIQDASRGAGTEAKMTQEASQGGPKRQTSQLFHCF
ncbi:unnamed protein product [Prorocentrum cordatum]|uniref:Glycerophosphocholine acyltransferase 1 n=1 Tax=Prorocentrum cordatum TaxID=2364126 RepID=A0ABN9VL05_9DINO|nr:unnamed protein product [Polarella glacialis]